MWYAEKLIPNELEPRKVYVFIGSILKLVWMEEKQVMFIKCGGDVWA